MLILYNFHNQAFPSSTRDHLQYAKTASNKKQKNKKWTVGRPAIGLHCRKHVLYFRNALQEPKKNRKKKTVCFYFLWNTSQGVVNKNPGSSHFIFIIVVNLSFGHIYGLQVGTCKKTELHKSWTLYVWGVLALIFHFPLESCNRKRTRRRLNI